eukprot:709526-Amphidinium_carterae.2
MESAASDIRYNRATSSAFLLLVKGVALVVTERTFESLKSACLRFVRLLLAVNIAQMVLGTHVYTSGFSE